VNGEAPLAAFTRSLYVPLVDGWKVIVSGRAVFDVDWATATVDPGAVRNRFRFALVVVQSSDAVIGTDVSVTLIEKRWETVPAALTLPEKVCVTVPALAGVAASASRHSATPAAAGFRK
jgi:hypothetical protein